MVHHPSHRCSCAHHKRKEDEEEKKKKRSCDKPKRSHCKDVVPRHRTPRRSCTLELVIRSGRNCCHRSDHRSHHHNDPDRFGLTWNAVAARNVGPTNVGAFAFAPFARRKQLWLFGGVEENYAQQVNVYNANLWSFDTRSRLWTLRDAGSGPSARAFLTGITDPVREQLLIFGGINYTFDFSQITVFSDLWAWSYRHGGWRQLSSTPGPGQLAQPGFVYHAGAAYLFGGIDQTFTDNNALWRYDIAADVWTLLIPNGAPGSPPARHDPRVTVLCDRLYLDGGSQTPADLPLSDSWIYDFRTGVWTDVTPPNNLNIEPPRTFVANASVCDRWVVYGGEIEGGSAGCGSPFEQNVITPGQTWIGRLGRASLTWTQVFPRQSPPPLKRAGAVHLGRRIWLFGGYNWICPGPGAVYNNTLWTFRVPKHLPLA